MNHTYRFLAIPFRPNGGGPAPDVRAMNAWITGELKHGERVIAMTSNPGVDLVLLVECSQEASA